MSIKNFNEIWENSPQTGDRLLVLLTIADGTDYTGASMVHEEYVAKMARISVERLRVLLNEMRESGDIEIYSPASDCLGVTLLKPWLRKNTGLRAYLGPDEPYLERIKGYVYLIQCGEYFKIGQTTNLSKRILQLGIQLPHKPQIVHVIATENYEVLERELHNYFSLHRLNGEWFSLKEDHIKTFCHYGCSHNGVVDERMNSHLYLDGQGFHVPQSFMPE
jgi:hypothetical protein